MTMFLSKDNVESVLLECWKLVANNDDYKYLNTICINYIDNHHSRAEEHIKLLSKYQLLAQTSLLSRSNKVLAYLNQLIGKLNLPNPLFSGFWGRLHSKNELLSFNSMSMINRLVLNKEELDSLTPYVKYFEQHPISDRSQFNLDKIAQLALSGENYDWVANNLKPYLKIMNKSDTDIKYIHQIHLDIIPEDEYSINVNLQYIYFPTDEIIIREFNEYIDKGLFDLPSTYWIQSFKNRSINLERFFQILKKFLAQNSNINALKFVAKCIELAGTRKELLILDEFESKERAEEILFKTRFVVQRKSLR